MLWPGCGNALGACLDTIIVHLTGRIVLASRLVEAGEEDGHVKFLLKLGDGKRMRVVRVIDVRHDVYEGSLHWVEREGEREGERERERETDRSLLPD